MVCAVDLLASRLLFREASEAGCLVLRGAINLHRSCSGALLDVRAMMHVLSCAEVSYNGELEKVRNGRSLQLWA